MKVIKFAELASTGQLLISRFHQLSAGKSGSGCGSAPPRIASMATVGATETIRKTTSARNAKKRVPCRDKTRRKCLSTAPPQSYRLSDGGGRKPYARKI